MSDERYLTRSQVREVDRRAIDEFGIPGVVLMENAALAVVNEIESLFASPSNTRDVVILCGGGNNGGDGYAIARHLHNRGYTQTLFAVVPIEKLSGDAAIDAHICQKMKLDIRPLETPEQLAACAERFASTLLIVDALLGTGFSGELRPHMAEVIRAVNASHETQNKLVLAVDVPSGLDCETGKAAQPTMEADVTVTFVAKKIGFKNPEAAKYLGRVVVGGIGAPRELINSIANS